ncbi:hypothetical protein DYG63_21075 [Yersinia enterocolitica]|nr:hypothetical protein [Yersinia enterocolitica]EKN5104374.1 hypothetical protein [Yersinia enterocolitica]
MNISSTPTLLLANGTDTATVTALVSDEFGTPLPNTPVMFSATGLSSLIITPLSDKTNALGQINATLTTTNAGTAEIRAKVTDNVSDAGRTVSVTFNKVLTYTNAQVQTTKNVTNFAASSVPSFPTTGFQTATFKIIPTNNETDNSLFDWTSSNSSTISLSNMGVVTLNAKPTGSITVIATPKDGQAAYSYSFNIGKWFTNGAYSATDAAQVTHISGCLSYSANGYSWRLPNLSDYVTNTSSSSQPRAIGALWNEWGNLTNWQWRNSSRGTAWYYTTGGSGTQYKGLWVNSGNPMEASQYSYPAACVTP